VTPTLSSRFGGPTTTAVNGLIAERQAGLNSEIITTVDPQGPGDSQHAFDRLSAAGVRPMCFPRAGHSASSEVWGVSPTLAVWLIRNLSSFDLVHLQYVWCLTSIFGCLLAKLRGIPVVVTPHESLTEHDIETASRSRSKRALKRLLRRFYLKTVDCLIFMSRLEQRDTSSGDRKSVCIFHAVTERASTRSLRVDTGPSRPLNFGFLGRNAKKKGLDRLIEVLGQDGSPSSWTLTAATTDPTPEQLEAIGSTGVGGRIRWLGFIDDPGQLFASCDVLVMPSTYEAFGMVAAEAMAEGIPVVVPENSGVAEIVREYQAGIIVHEATTSELTAALLALDADRASWPTYGTNGRRAVDERLTYRAYAEATVKLYGSLL
jgi:glycosyltransferase involved in cell wall biosynthesis